MSNSPAQDIPIVPVDLRAELNTAERRQRWLEVCLVLLIAFGLSVLRSVYLLVHAPSGPSQVSNFAWALTIARHATALLLLGYVLWRRGRRFADIGLRWSLRGVGVGLVIGVVSFAAYAQGYGLVQELHRWIYGAFAIVPSAKDIFGRPNTMSILSLLVNPFFEELIVRAYLMTEVTELTGSAALAVALSICVQFSYHLYYGWVGAISVSFSFLVLALYFARTRNALPVVVAHGFLDFYALLRLWW